MVKIWIGDEKHVKLSASPLRRDRHSAGLAGHAPVTGGITPRHVVRANVIRRWQRMDWIFFLDRRLSLARAPDR
jgi:hypothetical protein